MPAASTDGRRQSRCAVSAALLVPWTRTSTGQRSVWPQNLEPTTNGPPITRTVARFIQAPAQDPRVCSSTRQCWLQLWVSCHRAVLWLYSEFSTDYKCPDSTQLYCCDYYLFQSKTASLATVMSEASANHARILYLLVPAVLWCCWLGGRKGIRPVKNLSGGVLVWLSVWS